MPASIVALAVGAGLLFCTYFSEVLIHEWDCDEHACEPLPVPREAYCDAVQFQLGNEDGAGDGAPSL